MISCNPATYSTFAKACSEEDAMTALQILLILRARYWLVLFALVATVGVGLAVSLMLPKKYTASTSVLADVRSPDPVSAIIDRGTILPPNLLITQIDIIKSDRVARNVVTALKLGENPAVKEAWTKATGGKGSLDVWLAAPLQKKLSVKPSVGGTIITIDYEADDPDLAAAMANAFAQALIDINIELKIDQARQYSRWFGEQSQLLRENLEKAQSRLSAFQQEKGIVAKDEKLDAEMTKLEQLQARLNIVEVQAAETVSKQRSGSAGDALPEVAQNPLIAALKADIVRQEVKLDEIASTMGRNHPQYQRTEAELASLKRRLDIETRNIMSGFSAMRAIGRDNQAELKSAIQAQQKKVLMMKSGRDQLAVLQRDVDAAQTSYDAVNKRFAQISLESQANQTNVSVLTAAFPPTAPSSPDILRIMLTAVVVGALLGAGAAVGLEMLDRRVRSVDDVVEMLQLPVLGVIPRIEKPRRLAVLSRMETLALR
jgi:succinoglycan biosynthesis transport protein ExoP